MSRVFETQQPRAHLRCFLLDLGLRSDWKRPRENILSSFAIVYTHVGLGWVCIGSKGQTLGKHAGTKIKQNVV